MPQVTVYGPGGVVRRVYSPGARIPQGAGVRRASRVEPVNWVLRWLFLTLRWVFGDEGHAAKWTRTWHCCWRARTLVGSKAILGPYAVRDDALRAEQAWLLREWVGKP